MKQIRLRIISFGIFCIVSFANFAQQKQIDALKEQLKNPSISDSLKIKYWGDLGWYYSGFSSDSAFKYNKLALALSKKTNNLGGISQAYNDLGIIHYRLSQFDSSLVYYRKSLTIRKKINDNVGIASLYNKMGIAHNQLFQLDSAIHYAYESLKIYEKLGQKRFVAANLNNIANLYKDTKQFQKAFEKHQEALKIRTLLNDEKGILESFVGIGNVHISLKNIDSAKVYYEKSLGIATKLNAINELSTIYNNLGTLYKSENDFAKSFANFKKSLQIRQQLQDNYGIASTLLSLSDLQMKQKNYVESERYLHQGLSISKTIKANELQQDAYKQFMELKAYLKQPDSVSFYKEKFIEMQELLINNKVIQQLSELETKYQTAQKEAEIAAQKEIVLTQELALKNKSLYATIVTFAFLFLGLLFFANYKKNQFKRKQLQKEMDLKDALATIKTQNRLQEQRLRISRDLHDNIGAQLTFIISSLDNLKYLSKDANDSLKEKLTTISSFTSDTIFQLRDTIWAMNKAEISMEDLHTRVLSFVQKAKNAVPKTAFDINYDIDTNIGFSSLVGINIFRVIQEAINNAIKYADATKITIHLFQNEDNFTVSVIDDGKGFDLKEVALGNGLANMEQRISEINGSISIDSIPEKGTKIIIQVPLKN
jgi:signal transduction histidine kinase